MVAPNQKITYQQVQQSIIGLKKREESDISPIVMYILNPQISAFQYDVYDFNVTAMDFETGTIRIKVQDNIKMLITLSDAISTGEIYSEDDDFKIYLYFNYDDLTYDLHFKVLDNWEIVEHVDFKVSGDSKQQEVKMKAETQKFSRLSNYITKSTIINQYKTKKDKYFTEAVLDRYLETKEFNNEFIRTALLNEFKKPSAELITMLASALGKEFTTMPSEKVQERLQPLTELGLYSAVESLITGNTGEVSKSQPLKEEDYSYLQSKDTSTEKVDEKPTTSVKEETKVVPKKETTVDSKVETETKIIKEEVKTEPVVDKKEPVKNSTDKLKELGVNLDKKPVNNPTVTKEKLTDSGAVSIDVDNFFDD